MGISTHVLDTSLGRPAQGIGVTLISLTTSTTLHGETHSELEMARAVTDADGRVKPLLAQIPAAGTYRLVFETGHYLGPNAFFPRVQIDFHVSSVSENYHVPLLLNPFGFSTYRGS